jgi:hypothetical protein
MDLRIREDVLKRSLKCQRDASCTDPDKGGPMCAVKQSVKGVLFVDYGHSIVCHCMLLFGVDYICTCPVRKEIYARYGI